MKNFVKTYSIGFLTTLALILSACGEDRSHPSDPNAPNGEVPIVYSDPTAVIDLNASTHTYYKVDDAYTIDRAAAENPFTFSAANSQDNDEENQSIVSYDWNVTYTFSENCVDINTTTDQSIFKFANTDTNTTCRSEATDNGEINVSVTVTDDEGVTDTAVMSIRTN